MGAIEQIAHLTIEEFTRLYEQDGPFEFINGERRALMPPVALHGWTIRILFRLLDAYCIAHKLGETFTEMPFVTVYNSNWVKGALIPDLMFFAANRWQQYIAETPDWATKPFVLVPDLVVEVVSPNDLYTEIQDKVEEYRGLGVRIIWIVDPQRDRVNVYDGDHYQTLGKDETLTGAEVVPGLEIKLADLFAAPENQNSEGR
jgi:Uma2 family endonuclease